MTPAKTYTREEIERCMAYASISAFHTKLIRYELDVLDKPIEPPEPDFVYKYIGIFQQGGIHTEVNKRAAQLILDLIERVTQPMRNGIANLQVDKLSITEARREIDAKLKPLQEDLRTLRSWVTEKKVTES